MAKRRNEIDRIESDWHRRIQSVITTLTPIANQKLPVTARSTQPGWEGIKEESPESWKAFQLVIRGIIVQLEGFKKLML